ncbi:hypothetical protein BOX37_30315 [Nocardia mangyaensis]|uniref:Uncharacterized protein n=1 Tax=Nocardia mangyaensis TaxID=2213200 RepID=A0A1J0VZW3_9NOCA|nr:hypothetical protein [Nocardia mangyaensis]APE37513.1 hypothetical protein BOX37_30315 [Nocardia mangyaensis]
MPKIGDGVDAVTAFAGAAVAGMALFLPFAFSAASLEGSPYRVTSLVNSVPRAAALGLIVAVVIAVLVRPVNRPGLVWLTATCGALVLAINYFVAATMTSADVLTTQNYIDSLSGGVIYGALGICALRMRWPALGALGFALGTVVVFVYGEVVAVFSTDSAMTETTMHTPPALVIVVVVLLVVSTLRHRHGVMLPAQTRLAADLPITPIVAATVLALSALLATEWLSHEFDGRRASAWQVGIAVVVSVVAAFVAALLLPGRDGAGVLLAVSLAAAADSLGDAPDLGWSVVLVVALSTAGMLTGARWSTPWLALLGIAAISLYAIGASQLSWSFVWTIGVGLLACVAGYTFASIRVSYLPSAVLGLGALYLPSILWAIPTRLRNWPVGGITAAESTPGRAALAITIGAAAGLALLYRIRPDESATVVSS